MPENSKNTSDTIGKLRERKVLMCRDVLDSKNKPNVWT